MAQECSMKTMMTMVLVMVSVCVAAVASAQTRMTVYVTPSEDGFHTFIAAALHKKQVPVTVTTSAEGAMYRLAAATVQVDKKSTGTKIVSCLFAYCAGSADEANVSVTLVNADGDVVWAYNVNKARGGGKNRQSMAEAIAKHFKDDYLKKSRVAR
jgi:hypothetical protein